MKPVVIYVPGLNDTRLINKTLTTLLPLLWRFYHVDVYIFRPHWEKGTYKEKLVALLKVIDNMSKKDSHIYLVGQSAGGSMAFNAFSQRKNSITKVVNIDGRLLKGNYGFPLSLAAKNSAAFKESVLTFENTNSKTLTSNDKKKMLTLRPLYDELVPTTTAELAGVRAVTLPTVEHIISGILAVTIFSPIIFNFLKSRAS